MPADRRVLGAAGLRVRDLRDHRRVGAGRAQAGHVEGVAGLLHLLPDAEPVEHAQGVALQGDAGAEGGQVGLHLEDVDVDASLGEQDGGGGAGDAGADDGDA